MRIGVVCDLVEENWSSMDLVGMMLEQGLRTFEPDLKSTRLCPAMKRRFTRVRNASRFMFNGDRMLNRFWDYPRWLRGRRNEFDIFHIVDSSYSQLVHQLPPERTIVTCHDLDTFRSVLEPSHERRSLAFRTMSKHTLSGFRKAAKIICPSASTRENILAFGLVDPGRVSVVANGVHPDFSIKPAGAADRKADELLGPPRKSDLLHVGTTIPRKRVDTLLEVLALTRSKIPEARLIQAGGKLTDDQNALAGRLNVQNAVIVLPHLERSVLASVYRRSAALLLPSEREGFGLPLIEAMACGTPVIASDIAALREAGGTAAWYCTVGDTRSWSASASLLLHERVNDSEARSRRSAQCIERASRFSWTEYAKSMAAIYRDLLESRQ